MRSFFSPEPMQMHKALAVTRIIVGLLLMFHGWELFNPEIMNGYQEWDVFKGCAGAILVYAGKSSELISGTLLVLGLFTRVGALLTIGTFSTITFWVGQGRFWYDDQHPFMFALLGLLFFFTGPCAWSLDGKLFGHNNNH